MSSSKPTRVVIAGAGVAALKAVLALRDCAPERVQISLLAPDSTFSYRPASVGEPFGHARAQRFPMAVVLDGLAVDHVADRLAWVDTAARQVHTEGGGAWTTMPCCLRSAPAGMPGQSTR